MHRGLWLSALTAFGIIILAGCSLGGGSFDNRLVGTWSGPYEMRIGTDPNVTPYVGTANLVVSSTGTVTGSLSRDVTPHLFTGTIRPGGEFIGVWDDSGGFSGTARYASGNLVAHVEEQAGSWPASYTIVYDLELARN